MYVCMYVYTSQPKCGVVVLYTVDVRRFFSTLKSNGPIMYVYTSVCVYMFFTDQDPQVYVCMYGSRTFVLESL